MKTNRGKKIIGLNPVMTYLFLTLIVIILGFILSLFKTQNTYNIYSLVTNDFSPVTESVLSLFNLSGIKYIFTSSVSNFANFTVLTNLIIILIGIGILDKSGFLQSTVTLLTKKAKKTTVTFVIILLCLMASVIGDLAYIIFIPLSALFFFYGKRNPYIGIIASFAALTCGSGLSILFTSIDSYLREATLLSASVFDQGYTFGISALYFINFIVIIILAFVFTKITEDHIAKRLPKFEFQEEELEEDIVTKKELRGMIFSLFAGFIYLLIIIYNIIPGLPLSGNLLDYTQTLYIDKLFSVESFFTSGFVFIVAILFVILGFFYGLGSGSIKNNNDFVDALGHSLNGIGKTLVMIFMASIFINVFKQTNIGNTLVVYFANLIGELGYIGLPLVILLFIVTIISTVVVPSSIVKWPILATSAVPAFINSGMSAEFAQVVFRFGESVSMGLTPVFAYFIVYIAYIEKYNQSNKTIGIIKAMKYQLPYSLATFVILLFILILFFVINVPLGIGGSVSL